MEKLKGLPRQQNLTRLSYKKKIKYASIIDKPTRYSHVGKINKLREKQYNRKPTLQFGTHRLIRQPAYLKKC